MATYTGADKAISFLFDIVSNIANDYDETATYAVNDYAIFEGVLYKCTSAILTAETFTPAHWTAVLIMNEIGAGGGGGSSTLAGLSDVALASVANGDVLAFDSALNKWKNAASGGSGGHTYSQTEQIVGTWIDGKTIYENTYRADVSSSTSGSVQLPNNTDKVIRIEGFVVQITTDNEVMVNFCNDSTDKANVYYRVSDKTIQIRTGTSYGKGIYYLTVQYTKTV